MLKKDIERFKSILENLKRATTSLKLKTQNSYCFSEDGTVHTLYTPKTGTCIVNVYMYSKREWSISFIDGHDEVFKYSDIYSNLFTFNYNLSKNDVLKYLNTFEILVENLIKNKANK